MNYRNIPSIETAVLIDAVPVLFEVPLYYCRPAGLEPPLALAVAGHDISFVVDDP